MNNRLLRLLRDYGYDVQGNTIIAKGICGYSDRVWGNCRSVFDACEQLIPIIREHEFTLRFQQIVGGK